jgi:hypothetical protein
MFGERQSATPLPARVRANESTGIPFHSSAPARRGLDFPHLSGFDSTGMIPVGKPSPGGTT